MYTTAKLDRVENDRGITRQEDAVFYFELQQAVLLSLKEAGTISEIQFRNAETELKEQYRATILNNQGREAIHD